VVAVPGNHDSRHVGYLQYERTFGAGDSTLRFQAADLTHLALVAVDSSKPDIDEGETGREHYAWVKEGFHQAVDLRVFVCHHHLMPIPGTGVAGGWAAADPLRHGFDPANARLHPACV
jgi:3',5'-cyclic-AMP phosphodiesterase